MPKINKERDHPLDIALGQAVRLRRRELGLWGDVSGLSGDASGLTGNVSGLWGDASGLTGNVSGLTGNVTGLTGNVSGLTGDLDEIPASARPCNVEDWVEAAA
jgi:hypothetical protein